MRGMNKVSIRSHRQYLEGVEEGGGEKKNHVFVLKKGNSSLRFRNHRNTSAVSSYVRKRTIGKYRLGALGLKKQLLQDGTWRFPLGQTPATVKQGLELFSTRSLQSPRLSAEALLTYWATFRMWGSSAGLCQTQSGKHSEELLKCLRCPWHRR